MYRFIRKPKPELNEQQKAFEVLFEQLFGDPENISRETILDSMLCLARHLDMTELYSHMTLMGADSLNILLAKDFDNILNAFVEQLTNLDQKNYVKLC